jgi:hypothetical protein
MKIGPIVLYLNVFSLGTPNYFNNLEKSYLPK